MIDFDGDSLIPLAALSIPVVAIIGGITAGIVRGILRQRAWELVQRERIAAIERGIDPEKLGHLAVPDAFGGGLISNSPRWEAHRLRQGLFTGGLVTLFVGIALSVFLNGVADERNVWMVGLIPSAVGVALLISAWLTRAADDSPRMPSSGSH